MPSWKNCFTTQHRHWSPLVLTRRSLTHNTILLHGSNQKLSTQVCSCLMRRVLLNVMLTIGCVERFVGLICICCVLRLHRSESSNSQIWKVLRLHIPLDEKAMLRVRAGASQILATGEITTYRSMHPRSAVRRCSDQLPHPQSNLDCTISTLDRKSLG